MALTLQRLLPDRDVVAFHYRGYALSSGRPSARALFSDSLAIFDHLQQSRAGEHFVRKPNGQFVIAPDAGADFIASLPVAKFLGVGPVTAARMQRLGIQTGADLRAQSLAFLQQHFGKHAAWYLGIANGEDDRPVVADRPRKSSGSETTFERDLTASAEIESGVEAMADEVWAWCEKAKAFARTVTVKVKFADFHQVTRSRSGAKADGNRRRLELTRHRHGARQQVGGDDGPEYPCVTHSRVRDDRGPDDHLGHQGMRRPGFGFSLVC